MPPKPEGDDGTRRDRVNVRAVAAAWFGSWGLAAAALPYLLPALEQGPAFVVLVVVLPGIAGALAGAAIGPRILAPPGGALRAAALGLLIAAVAHLIFPVLLATGLWVVGAEGVNSLGMGFAALTVGPMLLWPITVPAGLLSGWLLYLLRDVLARGAGAGEPSGGG